MVIERDPTDFCVPGEDLPSQYAKPHFPVRIDNVIFPEARSYPFGALHLAPEFTHEALAGEFGSPRAAESAVTSAPADGGTGSQRR
jgi:hypothetical protein